MTAHLEPIPGYERFYAKVEIGESGCWQWTGYVNAKGYGHAKVLGKYHRAHRLMFQITRGPIPDGLMLDHLCRNRACVNPDHLEPVTAVENSRRSPHAYMHKGVCAKCGSTDLREVVGRKYHAGMRRYCVQCAAAKRRTS